jgi:hypothetical protein
MSDSKTFNHMFDIAVIVPDSQYPNPEDCVKKEWDKVKTALLKRLQYMDKTASAREGIESCDTYENIERGLDRLTHLMKEKDIDD